MWVLWLRRGLLMLSLIFSVGLVYVLATRSSNEPLAPNHSQKPLTRADGGMEQFTYLHSQDGVVKWEVRADKARVFDQDHKAILEKVEVTLFGKQGREMKLEGENGEINTASRDFTIANRSDDLAIELEGGYVVYTNHLSWSDETRVLSTNDPVKVVGHGMTVRGVGLIGNLDIEEFHIQKNVQVDIVH